MFTPMHVCYFALYTCMLVMSCMHIKSQPVCTATVSIFSLSCFGLSICAVCKRPGDPIVSVECLSKICCWPRWHGVHMLLTFLTCQDMNMHKFGIQVFCHRWLQVWSRLPSVSGGSSVVSCSVHCTSA